jgi:hypothetical protein
MFAYRKGSAPMPLINVFFWIVLLLISLMGLFLYINHCLEENRHAARMLQLNQSLANIKNRIHFDEVNSRFCSKYADYSFNKHKKQENCRFFEIQTSMPVPSLNRGVEYSLPGRDEKKTIQTA